MKINKMYKLLKIAIEKDDLSIGFDQSIKHQEHELTNNVTAGKKWKISCKKFSTR